MLEQHIAVFGESGSGKTVLISSFYGSEQEPENARAGAYNVVAENPSQGTQLHQNYLGMKKSGVAPEPTRFSSTDYRFLLRLKGSAEGGALKSKPFDSVRLVWHDYPGEWFDQGVSGELEAGRRIETFRSLLGAHVALLMVDGQKLLDNAGEEGRYLKSLFTNFHNSLVLLRDDLLEDGKPLTAFPRIWIVALSKADLLPDLDVNAFKELVIEKAGQEVIKLAEVLGGMVESREALAVGEDFVRISSAKFKPESIEVEESFGVDLILPMASVLPLEQHVRWAKTGKLSRKLTLDLVGNAEVVSAALTAATPALAKLMQKNKATAWLALAFNQLVPQIETALQSAHERLEAVEDASATKRENLAATLQSFRNDLTKAEADSVLVRSLR
ncbi:ethanolamine utilization protein EutP (predicted NTPase) [Nocardioides zeae]|uniref:Ethanolamine utilization protein EutP (Predicted NTPase) n=1 Tax=Nocardioides zeae TaxID=1457234 RepID=A0ACC6IEB9_9ACTN|nr:hypothetical protein [Nocardioides zeae]MDR6174301.1 ethanolamine utilization protein EutP (predicted NTPase) [Nocardioides zeae]MDR6209106.1 ethanolamine utilization protein EutP (predicted NTPase) [Nocardioides zeae]